MSQVIKARCDFKGCGKEIPNHKPYHVLIGGHPCPAGGRRESEHAEFHLCVEHDTVLLTRFFQSFTEEAAGREWAQKNLDPIALR